MCLKIIYTVFGLYVTYCCCFCANLGYVIRKENRGQIITSDFTEVS